MDGLEGIKGYRIEFNKRVIGAVVVVGCDNLKPHPGLPPLVLIAVFSRVLPFTDCSLYFLPIAMY